MRILETVKTQVPCPPAVFLLLLLAACASRINPTGGPKDTAPPVVVQTVPPNSSVRFSGNRLSLTFDEFVQLKDGGTGIMISPPLSVPPEVILRGKTVELRLKAPLDNNTTYTVTVGQSLTDIRENNPLPEYGLVFSTGNLLDSLSLSGQLTDAYTNQPVKDALVMLYTHEHDSLPQKTLPRYFTRSDASGHYTIKNVREGPYMAFALADANSNYLFDQPEEKIGFSEQGMQLIDSVKTGPLDFRLFVNPESRQRLLKSGYTLPGKLNLKYAAPVQSWSLRQLQPEGTTLYRTYFIPGRDSLTAWFPKIDSDSLVLVSTVDGPAGTSSDTLRFNLRRMAAATGMKARRSSRPDTTLRFTHNLENGKLRQGDTLFLYPSQPFERIDTGRIFLLQGTDTIPYPFSATGDSLLRYVLPGLGTPGKGYLLHALPGVFESMYGQRNDTLRLSISTYDEDDLGLLAFTINADSLDDPGPLLLELTAKDGKTVSSRPVIPGQEIVFANLSPNSYGVRLIFDQNGNGRWDPGNFQQKKQPEKVRYYSGEITIRAGWDLELVWELGARQPSGN